MPLLKYLTGRDSLAKAISRKPLFITTRDAVLVTVVTIIVTMIFIWCYYVATDTPSLERAYGTLLKQTILSTMILQYIYEYIGINNIIAESSIRYARGTTLHKYTSRRDAMVYKCYYRVLIYNQKHNKYSPNTLDKNFKLLRAIVTKPVLIGRLLSGGSISKLIKLFPSDPDNPDDEDDLKQTTELLDELLQMPDENKEAFEAISEHFNENIAYDIIVNGFDKYTVTHGPLFKTIKNIDSLEESGKKIASLLKT